MRILFVIPGDINTPSGGYRYDRMIIEKWRAAGHAVEILSLNGSYPMPTKTEKTEALELTAHQSGFDICVVDGLAGGGFPALIETLSRQMPCVLLIHHPLALENGIGEAGAAHLKASEQAGLAHAKAVVTTSPATTETVKMFFETGALEIFTVLPGFERGKQATFRNRQTKKLLSVGSITERKGHDVLIEALATIANFAWSLTIVGPQDFDPALYQRLRSRVKELHLEGRIRFVGGLSEEALDDEYEKADIFVLASRYEGYGMAYAEAIVRGLPVIGTRAGAIPGTVPEAAGILVPPDDVEALAAALKNLLLNDYLRFQKHQGALKVEPDFPTWEGSAALFLDHLEDLI